MTKELSIPPQAKDLSITVFGREFQQMEYFLECAYEESTRLFSTYLPEGLPTEPVHITAYANQDEEVAMYLGKIAGRHHITVRESVEEIEHRNVAWVDFVSSINHERLHQRTAECVPEAAMWGTSLGEQIAGRAQHSASDVTYFLKQFHKRQSHAENNTLVLSLMEGIAVTGELFLLQKQIEESSRFQDERLTYAAEKVKREKIKLLHTGGTVVPFYNDRTLRGNIYSFGTLKIIRPLAKRFGHENLFSLLQAIDVEECYGLKTDDTRFYEILNDPRKIPGLENHPLIQESYHQ